jgi:hypothetical protein
MRDRIETRVGRDPVEPRSHRDSCLATLPVLPCAQQGVLDGILGVLQRAEHAVAMDQQFTAVALRESVERRFVAGSYGCG